MSLFKKDEPELTISYEEKRNRLSFVFGEATENNYNSPILQPNENPVGNEKIYKVISEADKEQYQNQVNNQYYNNEYYINNTGYYNNNQYQDNQYYNNNAQYQMPIESTEKEQMGFDRSGYLKSLNKTEEFFNKEPDFEIKSEKIELNEEYYETISNEEDTEQEAIIQEQYSFPIVENAPIQNIIYQPNIEQNTLFNNSFTHELSEEEKREKLLNEWKLEEEKIKIRQQKEREKEEEYIRNIEVLNKKEESEFIESIEPEKKELSKKEIKKKERFNRVEEREKKAAYRKALRLEKKEAKNGKISYKGE